MKNFAHPVDLARYCRIAIGTSAIGDRRSAFFRASRDRYLCLKVEY
ncbi:MAG: hypothetical protein SVX43_12925 [Cyanobacteriota bacterium]|nr:hypothetical protein [Cyanobacteriota bacterium]